VTAEAFARYLVYREDVRDAEAWLFRTAFRLLAKELRRESRDARQPSEVSGPAPDEVSDELRSALGALSVEQRAAVYLHYYLDLPVAEVARLSGAPVATTKVRLHRARRALRSLLERSEGATLG
jgi:RNA polymerase sigma-70 factor (ECF subfamily)